MNPATCIQKFFEWITRRQNRLAEIHSAQLQLAEQQHRAEEFALEQKANTLESRVSELESERDGLNAKIISINNEHALTIKKLEKAQVEIQRLHKDLDMATKKDAEPEKIPEPPWNRPKPFHHP